MTFDMHQWWQHTAVAYGFTRQQRVNSLRPSDAYIFVNKLTIIGSDNGLSPERRQAIIWTSAGILLIESLGANSSEILSAIHAFSFKKIHLKTLSMKWWPFSLGLNEWTNWGLHKICHSSEYNWRKLLLHLSVILWSAAVIMLQGKIQNSLKIANGIIVWQIGTADSMIICPDGTRYAWLYIISVELPDKRQITEQELFHLDWLVHRVKVDRQMERVKLIPSPSASPNGGMIIWLTTLWKLPNQES